MKIRLKIKDPDGISNSIREAVHDSLVGLQLPIDVLDLLYKVRLAKAQAVLSRWIAHGEQLIIDIDTDLSASTVVEQQAR